MQNIILYIVVFLGGAAVLALEILGTRILGPFYGVSLFLWSALIAVTLIALSVGYALGGRLADRHPKFSRLCVLLTGAGIWFLLIPWIKKPVLIIVEPFGLRFAVLVAAFILFAPPLTLLGMISPYAIRVRTLSLSIVGKTAGDLYAISTIGSVISALLTGFLLIPNIGVGRLTSLFGLMLILTGIVGFVIQLKTNAKRTVTLLILLFGAAAFRFVPTTSPGPQKGLLAIKQSRYAELRVLDVRDKRHLIIDGGVHTIVDPTTYKSQFPYTAVIGLSKDFFTSPGELLLIGLGGGAVAKDFASSGWKIDAVEIDPVVVDLAYKYFGLDSSESQVFETDGRRFLTTCEKNYDLIAMDAFGSSSIPFHLITRESFGLIKTHLSSRGIFAINIEARSWSDLIIRSLAATLRTHFQHVVALPTTVPATRLGNIILFASDRGIRYEQELEWDNLTTDFKNSIQFYRYRAWKNRYKPDAHDAPVLTDDLNPIDLWSEEINFVARKRLHRYFTENGMGW